MKILFVSTILNTIQLFMIPHIKYLLENGNEVSIACNSKGEELSPELKELGCTIYEVAFNRNPLRKENIRAYQQIRRIIEDDEFELIHVHTPVAAFVTRMSARKFTNVRMLYTAHGFHFYKGGSKKNNFIYKSLEKVAARWTDGIITMNEEDFAAAKHFKLRRDNSVFKVHGVGVNLTKFSFQTNEVKKRIREKYNFLESDFIVICVGELSYRKNQELVIKAIGKITRHIKNIKLLLVGAGIEEENYRKLVQSLGLENEIIFLGYRRDIEQLMLMSDLAVSTSRQEGLPVNVLEAMASGLPLAVSNVRGNHDLVKNGKNGFTFDVDDVDGCASALERLYNSQEKRKEFSLENRKLISLYSQENVIREMQVIYEKYFHNNTAIKVGHLSKTHQL